MTGPTRRRVQISDAFFDQIEELLEDVRRNETEPSVTDFLVLEIPAIVERFATGFDDLPEIVDGVAAGRMLIAAGVLVPVFVVFGVLVADGSVEIIGIDIDMLTELP